MSCAYKRPQLLGGGAKRLRKKKISLGGSGCEVEQTGCKPSISSRFLRCVGRKAVFVPREPKVESGNQKQEISVEFERFLDKSFGKAVINVDDRESGAGGKAAESSFAEIFGLPLKWERNVRHGRVIRPCIQVVCHPNVIRKGGKIDAILLQAEQRFNGLVDVLVQLVEDAIPELFHSQEA